MLCSRKTRGLTLIEVVAALALTGLSISSAVLLFQQLGDEAARIRGEGASTTRDGNASRVLRGLLRSAEASADTTERFGGDERAMSYGSWCAMPSGWGERCQVLLTIDHRQDSSVVVARLSSGELLRLDTYSGGAEFRYLGLPGRDSGWVRYWGESPGLPAAVAIVHERDTVVFPVGGARD